ncbi:MAG TPA: diguanylate cyclase [Clostridiales bacterium]|nr:diguanylate cyclase [Clostridiales bacterium]
MKLDFNRQKRIFEYLFINKFFTLFIFGMVAFNEYMKYVNYQFDNEQYFNDIIPITIFMVIMLLISRLWFATLKLEKSSKKYKIIQFVESFIIFSMFTILIAYAPDVTQYKLLFLLVIITSSLQYGFRYGIIISIIASGIVLTIDLIYMRNAIVNEAFQNDLILIGVFILTAWLLGYYEKIEREHREYITQLAIYDGLTEIYNHRHFYDSLKMFTNKAKQSNTHVSLLIIDIDHFKHYNDMFGHQQGDAVLKKIASILKENTRPEDFVARYGGEEFAVILPNTDEKRALIVAERIRQVIEKTEFEGEEYQPNGNLTVSIGVSSYPDKAQSDTDLVKSADDALYRAKFFNKNRVETYFSILQELKDDISEKDITLLTSIKTLISVINAKDRYTYGHTERVVMYAQMIGEKLKLSEEDMKNLKYGAYLHDIGKINIPEQILNKKMPLTSKEWDILKQHPANGAEIISPVECLSKVKPVILHHHEHYDGTGYPYGLKGEDIPYLARIMTVVDSFDAMTSNRVYKPRRQFDEAIEELRKFKGIQFDPEITDVFISVLLENKFSFSSGDGLNRRSWMMSSIETLHS